MNERIKELAEHAGFMPDNFISRWDAEFVLFAELIVRECARKVTLNEARNIFEYFGVEE